MSNTMTGSESAAGNRKVKLEIKNMTKHYDNGDGVENINLKVYENEIVTFLGPSGCGKSTILRTIAGFLDVTSGDILVDGQSIVNLPPENRPTAMVFQSYNLWPHMTIYENLAFGLKLRKIPKKTIDEDIKNMLALVSMSGTEKKYPGQLSGGQQQRIAIARSLLLKPALLLLDEPFSALDAKIRQQMREELKRIQSNLGITVIFVTHDQEEAMAISHRIVVMNKGKFDQVGTPDEIYDQPATLHVASFIGEMNFIKKDKYTIAVRPEDLLVDTENGEIDGIVSTVMLMGHYVSITVHVGDEIVKCYVNRDIGDHLQVGQKVKLKIGKSTQFPLSA
ncbi:MAG: ABC transporter ATP-binding protein [Lachnospiraceae bacterium]